MPESILLCIDEQTWQHPELIGFEGEVLGKQPWLAVRSCGEDARRFVGNADSLEEAWIVSCDDVEPINLAATLKGDKPGMRVRLVTAEGCGSLLSRAHTAGIDEVIGLKALARCYAECKGRFMNTIAGFDAHALPCSDESSGSGRVAASDAPSLREKGGLESSSRIGSVINLPSPIQRSRQARRIDEGGAEDPIPLASCRQDDPNGPSKHASSQAVVHAAKKAFCLPVVSGSGGAGKSTVSVLSAYNASSRGLRTLLVDYDLQFGDAAFMAGAKSPLTLDDALGYPEKLEREVARGMPLTVVAAPSRLEAADEIARDIPAFLDRVSGWFDVVVANTGSTWADHHAVLLERSSAALFLVDQRMSSVRACRHALDLCARCGIASGPFKFALNKCAKGAPLTSSDVSNALQGTLVFELRDGGRDVEDCLSGGAIGDLVEMGNELYGSIDYIMGQLLPKGKGGFSAAVEQEEERRGFRRRGRHVNKRRGRKAS